MQFDDFSKTNHISGDPHAQLSKRVSFHAFWGGVSFNLTEAGLKTRRLLFESNGWLFKN